MTNDSTVYCSNSAEQEKQIDCHKRWMLDWTRAPCIDRSGPGHRLNWERRPWRTDGSTFFRTLDDWCRLTISSNESFNWRIQLEQVMAAGTRVQITKVKIHSSVRRAVQNAGALRQWMIGRKYRDGEGQRWTSIGVLSFTSLMTWKNRWRMKLSDSSPSTISSRARTARRARSPRWVIRSDNQVSSK